MPKSNEKDAYFFPHDCNARNDPKILALRSVYGAEGYGIYFMLIEILREQPDFRLSINKYTWNALAMQMQTDASTLENIITDCCNEFVDNGSALLINDGQFLYSESLLRRMGKISDISNVRREAAKKRWNSKGSGDSTELCISTTDALAMQKQSTSNAIKENKRKENKRILEGERKTEKKKDPFAEYAGDDADLLAAFRGFEEMRDKIKKPMTSRAKSMLLTELNKLSKSRNDQIKILDQSTANCWQSVYALKTGTDASGSSQRGGMTTADKMDVLRTLHDTFSAEEGGGVDDQKRHF